ncbi:2-amino-4-oxopentanoate thiolase subunit OrtA [Anaerophilus nitritogenes]|uniref:2-amino-4-oxopentanoate thiolase subunit OrtA n=1 Tax=Anaerophilus nitritogenes TaxID=2498136 RepID=UPI00101BB283|nr:2-amino-4-oxopentanoate thiolase subunit OrtA [Anaerophilus nitritogenes]
MKIKKGDWVLTYHVVLTPDERAPQVPDDTKKVPLESWVKGFLQEDAEIGDEVTVKTITGRMAKGKLLEVNPAYQHNFGNFVPELLQVGIQLKSILWGGEQNE